MKVIYIVSFYITFLYSQVDYQSDIQPIFNNNCIFCHQNGGSATLNLATYSGTMTGGWSGPAIVVGDHQNSLLYQRIIQPTGTDGSMPPNDPLSQSQIDLIAQWIDEGAGNSLSTDDVFLPKGYTLHQNYPNPFNPTTLIRYDLPQDAFVKITVFNMYGKVIKTIINEKKSSGSKFIHWDATNNQGKPVSSGVYLYRIKIDNFMQTKKMIFIK